MESLTIEQRRLVIEANLLVDLLYPELKIDFTPTKNEVEKMQTEAKTLFQSQLDMEKMHADVYSRMFANLKN